MALPPLPHHLNVEAEESHPVNLSETKRGTSPRCLVKRVVRGHGRVQEVISKTVHAYGTCARHRERHVIVRGIILTAIYYARFRVEYRNTVCRLARLLCRVARPPVHWAAGVLENSRSDSKNIPGLIAYPFFLFLRKNLGTASSGVLSYLTLGLV